MAKAMGMPQADKPEDFITALLQLQEACGVVDLKMSDYGITIDEAMTLAKGARSMQGGLFEANPCEMTDEDCAGIFEKSYRQAQDNTMNIEMFLNNLRQGKPIAKDSNEQQLMHQLADNAM